MTGLWAMWAGYAQGLTYFEGPIMHMMLYLSRPWIGYQMSKFMDGWWRVGDQSLVEGRRPVPGGGQETSPWIRAGDQSLVEAGDQSLVEGRRPLPGGGQEISP